MPRYYRPKERFEIVQPEEIGRYIAEAGTKVLRLYLALVYLTGARASEIRNLKREDVTFDPINGDITFVIHSLKRGKIGYCPFRVTDPLVQEVWDFIKEFPFGTCPFGQRTVRHYQMKLMHLNQKLHPEDKENWLTLHYLRHSRITFIARILQASSEEIKGWTGHRSTAFEDYFQPRKVERFRGKIR